jgi:hypothetical protein
MKAATVLLAFVCLFLFGCSAVYRYNVKHAYVPPGTKLAPAEIDQIIQTISNTTLRPIIAITRLPTDSNSRDEVTVYTQGEPDTAPYMIYDFQKSADGIWRITDSGFGHVSVW